MLVVGTPIFANIGTVDGVEFDSGGFVTSARVDRTTATAGQPVAITASVKSTTAPPPAGRFVKLAVAAVLPSGAECATRVRPAGEIRPANATENARRGSRSNANTVGLVAVQSGRRRFRWHDG